MVHNLWPKSKTPCLRLSKGAKAFIIFDSGQGQSQFFVWCFFYSRGTLERTSFKINSIPLLNNYTQISKIKLFRLLMRRMTHDYNFFLKKAFHFTLNAQPSTGCISSMYRTRKSTCCRKWPTIRRNSRRSAINSGQEQEPKLTTKGRPGVWKSNKFRFGFLSPRHCKGTLIADFPRRAFFTISLQRTYRRVFCISDVNMVSQKSSGCTRHFVHFRNNFCTTFVPSGIKFSNFPKAKARLTRLANT